MPTKKKQVYFVRKETPRKSDYRFNYRRTRESALKYYVGQYREEERRVGMSYSTHFVKTFKKMFTYKTRAEAEEACKQLNANYVAGWGSHTMPN